MEDGFAGYVVVCNKRILIDTKTGFGFHEVFDLMKPIICHLSNKYKSIGNRSAEDIRQDICVAILEGIIKYKEQNASLSTFLFGFINNKMIDKTRKRKCKVVQCDVENKVCGSMSVDEKMDLMQRTSIWDDKWKNIITRIFVNGDKISDVANDEHISPWGLTRAIRRQLENARKD